MSAGTAASDVFECRRWTRSGRPKRGHQAEENGCAHGHGNRESEYVPVRRKIEYRSIGGSARKNADQEASTEPGEENPKRCAEQGEQRALRQELPDDAAAARSNGEAHADLPLPRARA